ncbi:ribonuclease HII [bacterium]|nr:ribonuclease HII [bacterium]
MNSLFKFDEEMSKEFGTIIGTDEAGRGPAAGDLYVCAYCFKKEFRTSLSEDELETLKILNDSKKLSEKKRKELYKILIKCGHFKVGTIKPEIIDKINILQAVYIGMQTSAERVIEDINPEKFILLVDGNRRLPNFKQTQQTIIKGDSKSATIAAASIIAKVSRDNYMEKLSEKYPEYNFKKNKGYLTAEHIQAIKKVGASDVHRLSFLKNILN